MTLTSSIEYEKEIPTSKRKAFREARLRKLSPAKAIKVFCESCMGWSLSEARACESAICPLWAYGPAGIAARKAQK
jgi:hypothetical protein